MPIEQHCMFSFRWSMLNCGMKYSGQFVDVSGRWEWSRNRGNYNLREFPRKILLQSLSS